MKYRRIQVVSILMIFVVVLFGVFWFVEYSMRLGTHLFFMEWSTYPFVDDDFVVTNWHRFVACLYYSMIYITVLSTFAATLLLFNRYRKGFIFDTRTSTYLMCLGGGLVGIFLVGTLISSTEAAFLSQWNAEGAVAMKYYYSSSNIVIGLTGIGFWVMGWISHEALRIQRENENFI